MVHIQSTFINVNVCFKMKAWTVKVLPVFWGVFYKRETTSAKQKVVSLLSESLHTLRLFIKKEQIFNFQMQPSVEREIYTFRAWWYPSEMYMCICIFKRIQTFAEWCNSVTKVFATLNFNGRALLHKDILLEYISFWERLGVQEIKQEVK